jgi:hypothetical protein
MRSVEDLGDLDADPPDVAVDNEVPIPVIRHLEDDRADVPEAAVILILVAVEISLVVINVHEADSGRRAAQAYLELGAAGKRSEIPV